MARPIPDIITQGIEGWDAEVNSNFDLIFEGPIPVKVFATVAALPAAGSFDDCVAYVDEAGFKRRLFASDGTSWFALTPREPRVITVVAAGETANVVPFTVQLQDLEGNDLAAKRLCKVWMSDTDEGVPQATGMTGPMVATTGLKILNHSDPIAEFIPDATGLLVIDVTVSDARTKHMMVDSGHGLFSGSGIWT